MIGSEGQALDRSKEKLKRDGERIITAFFDHVLDIAEIAIGDPVRYKTFRSKVLRFGNDAIRDLKRILDKNYVVKYVADTEDLIEVTRPVIRSRPQEKS